MNDMQIANLMQTYAAILTVGFALFWIVPTIRLDTVRQSLFLLRDELFDYALEGNIAFDDPAYCLLRDQMNGLIRYAHHLTVFRGLMSIGMRMAAGTDDTMSWNIAWGKATAHLKSDSVRDSLKEYHDRAMWIVIKHLITGSPLLICLIGFAMFATAARHIATGGLIGLRQLVTMACKAVFTGPFDPRLIEEAAICEPA